MSQWANQYKALIETKPSFILPCTSGKVSEIERKMVQTRASLAKRIFVELGSGSGGHLLELALRNPDALHVGFEIRYKRIFRTIQKAEKASIENILVIKTRAEQLNEIFEKSSIDGVYVNFPDPWDKRRWVKHRLLNRAFLQKLVEFIKIGGVFSYKTDHAGYFDETLSYVSSMPTFTVTKMTRNLAQSEFSAFSIDSEFENLFKSKGLPIFFLEAKKTRDPVVAAL